MVLSGSPFRISFVSSQAAEKNALTRLGNLPFALLGLVASRPDGAHGYLLQSECEAIADDFWGMNFGRVYRILDRLAKDGHIIAHEEPQSGRPSRNVYRITERGRQSLDDWLLEPIGDSPRPLRDELSLKILFLNTQNLEEFARLIKEQRSIYLDKLSLVKRRRRRLEKAGIDMRVVQMVMDGADIRVRADLDWLEHIESLLIRKF